MIILRRLLFALLAAFSLASVHGQNIERIIPNGLNETWPLEHVYFEFNPSEIKGPMTCTIQGVTRPTQAEQVTVNGQPKVRLWTVATIDAKDDQGKPISIRGPQNIQKVKAIFSAGTAPSPLSIRQEGDYYIIDNGTYEFKVRNYKGDFPQPTTIDKVPHWIGGMRVKGTDKWDGKADFEGTALMKGGKTEIVSSGPVHIDIKVTLYSQQPAGAQPEMVNAVPLAAGKQSFLYPPNEIPTEKVPRLNNEYEVLLRFVAQDPWIDVSERYDFARDPAIKPWGFNQEEVSFGGPDGMPIDTAMWLRWFEWDQFGGNTDIAFVPAQQRPAQKGRPFAMLRPIWNQGPGGAQDFFLTSGGKTNDPDDKRDAPNPLYKPDAPAIGIYAAFPSKWVGPFSQTIVCRAENGNSGSWRLPLVPAEDPVHGIVPGFHYGQRAYGICVGPRRMFDSTWTINGMVRRHTDWTLIAIINKYILDWPRDRSKAGPHLLVTRERINQLRSDFQSGKDTPEMRILRAAWADLKPREDVLNQLQAELKAKQDALTTLSKAPRTPGDDPKARNAQMDALDAEKRDIQTKLEAATKASGGNDNAILRLIVEGKGEEFRLPSSELWRQRRYQDDFINPTQRAVRAWTNMALVDLFADGEPVGGADQAAMGYIVTDPDSWMGWRDGWMPGNPNFHTDKYKSALYIGGAMLDHPHAKEWIEFARRNLEADANGVLLPPDGVGVESPGYSGYAQSLILPMATVVQNLGFGNIPADNPLFKDTTIWHRKLLTPVDPRLARRHEAPIGDTHRWDSGLGEYFGDMARFYEAKDPKFASESMSIWRSLSASGVGSARSPIERLLAMDYNLPETKLQDMDWSSQSFYGFGAILRTNFGTPKETFLTYKAGPVRGHYHNDENSYHYYALGMPVSLNYNCSYHPRGDHAALSNSMTFGNLGTVTNNQAGKRVEAQEQMFFTGHMGAFISKPAGDLIVSEGKGDSLTMSPIHPEDAEFQRDYPHRTVNEIIHRRLLLMVKHPAASKMTDYLVVRDETKCDQPQQVNIHLLARDAKVEGRLVEAVGQQGVDMDVYLAQGEGPDGGDPKVDIREWHYADEFMYGPEEYAIHPGETVAAWDSRMDALMQANHVNTLPLPGFKPLYKNANAGETKPWLDDIEKTDGMALVPPKNWNTVWQYGEYQKWLRIQTKPGTPITWVLYAYRKGDQKPVISTVDASTVRIQHDGESEDVSIDSAGGVKVKNASGEQVILAANKLPPMGEIKDDPSAIYRGE